MLKKIKLKDKDYQINTTIFSAYIIILAALAVSAYFYYDQDTTLHLYVKCNSERGCENPYYKSPDCGTRLPAENKICDKERFEPGETYGQPAPPIVEYFGAIATIGFAIALAINHYLYNRTK